MKKYPVLFILILFLSGILIQLSCKKKSDTDLQPVYMQVDLPRHEFRHDLYYRLPHDERSIELDFNVPLDANTIPGNILFSDQDGELSDHYDLQQTGNQVLLMFHPDFELKDGWKYYLSITNELKSTNGLSLPEAFVLECRTNVKPMPAPGSVLNGDSTQRYTIAIISDIHMGDPRANSNNYCWFGKNKEALEDFLDYVLDGSHIKQLVILGDLFDEWLVPYTISPFDSSVNITSTREFFLAVAGSSVNENIFHKLNAIANDDNVDLVYVPGNHDMLGTADILHEIIPNAAWEGGPEGLGRYSPFPEMILEHGHRYDFFNCPHPLVNEGHELPPGYFVSRLYAQGMMTSAGSEKTASDISGSFEFRAAWDIAYLYTIAHFMMNLPDAHAKNILMGGIDGYLNPMSFDGAEDMYAANIEDFWPATQAQNQVPVPIACCFHAIWNGHSDLYTAAETQYMKQPPSPETYKIVGFGHTHEPMLEVYPKGNGFTSIYANSGSWIDADQSSHKVRTFLLLTPKAWTGSELDVVGLYQYNLNTDNKYKPVWLAEESID